MVQRNGWEATPPLPGKTVCPAKTSGPPPRERERVVRPGIPPFQPGRAPGARPQPLTGRLEPLAGPRYGQRPGLGSAPESVLEFGPAPGGARLYGPARRI